MSSVYLGADIPAMLTCAFQSGKILVLLISQFFFLSLCASLYELSENIGINLLSFSAWSMSLIAVNVISV